MGIIVDSFAGGGGASTGIERALGRSPDIAINHDPVALALHQANHPDTLHMVSDIWDVSPGEIVAKHGPVDLLWASPDCKHFSKAKGGKPVSKRVRGLSWVVTKWAAKARPKVIILENVEEFREWGPVLKNGMPCRNRRGKTFKHWADQLRRLGYQVEHNELRACDYGAPTIRKRLFVIARCDGRPIVWPKPTHRPASVSEDGIVSSWARGHGLTLADLASTQPYRTAADIIDWSIPCPSIFMDPAEAKKLGLKRPLAKATLKRIARGVMRYVVNNPKPFLVSVAHGDSGGRREYPLDEPLGTQAASNTHALVTPIVTRAQHGGGNRDPQEPLHTVCASTKDQNAIIAPVLTKFRKDNQGASVEEPMPTVTANGHNKRAGCGIPLGVVAPTLIPRYGERPGQEPRVRDIEEPMPTVVPTGNGAQVVSAHLMTMRNSGKPFNGADEPTHTVTAGGAGLTVVSAFLAQHNGGPRPGAPAHSADEPVSTVTGSGSQQTVVTAHMMPHYGASVARDAEEPVGTVTAGGGGKQAVVAAHLLNMKGSDRRDGPADAPGPTITSGGNHAFLVASFLQKYYGTDQNPELDEPLHTVSTKDRFSLVTVLIDGEEYVIVDIGMRMLTPRELFRAQSFDDAYIIDRTADGEPITKTAQTRMCGNSVCPAIAEALVRANVPYLAVDAGEVAA